MQKLSSIRKDSKTVSILLLVQTPGKQLARFITRKQHCIVGEVLEWVQHTDADPREFVMTVGCQHDAILVESDGKITIGTLYSKEKMGKMQDTDQGSYSINKKND